MSKSTSSRSSHHRHSSSVANSEISENRIRSYQPVPPLKTQIQTLEEDGQNILSIVTESNDIPSFLNLAANFNEALIKILNDLIRCFTSLYRRQNPVKKDILAITDLNYGYFKKLKDIFGTFRTFQGTNLLNYLDQFKKLQMLVEFWSFVEDNEAIFINEIWHYCSEVYVRTESNFDDKKNKKEDDHIVYKEAYRFFCNCLNDHYDNLNKLQLKFISGVNQFDLSRGYQDEEEDEEEDYEDDVNEEEEDTKQMSPREQRKIERQLRKKVGDAIRRSYSVVFPTLKEYWKNAFDWKLKEVQRKLRLKEDNANDEDYDQEADDSDYDVIIEDKIIYELFDNRLSQIETFYKMIDQLKDSNSTKLAQFISKEASLSFNDQIASLREMWEFASRIAPKVFCEYEMTHFGSIIVDNLKSEAKFNLTPSSLNRLGEIFEQAENIEDLQTAQEVINLIIEKIKDKIAELENLYKDEIQIFGEEFDADYYKKYVKQQHDSSKAIHELAMNIAESIKKSEAAAFVHQKLDPDVDIYRSDDNNNNDDSEYPMKNEIKKLVDIAPDFYIMISNHIADLNRELNLIYDNLDGGNNSIGDNQSQRSSRTYNVGNDNDPMANYHNQMHRKMEKRAKNKQANDALSVYAPSSKSVSLRSNTKNRNLKKIYRIRVELIQEAICRTYEELFASIRVLIINAVRYTSDELAESYNKMLETSYKKYLSHLNVLKKWYIQEMKVDKVQAIEARMATNQSVSKEIINDCIKESLREMATQYAIYYIKRNEKFDDTFDEQIEDLDGILFEKMENIKSTVHIKQLEIIERQYRIEMKKEENREPAQVTEGERRVRTLLASKQYDEARKEKDKVAKLRVSLWNEKKKEIQKKYKKIRNEKLEQQARDLEFLEQSYQKKRTLIEKDYRLNQENSRKSLKASLHNQVDFHVKLAAKLNLSGNPNKVESKKTINSNNMPLVKSYEAIVSNVLYEKHIEI